jgi:ATP-dependent Clp protease ATP-binding subunit ClpX
MIANDDLSCSFCGKPKSASNRLIVAEYASICKTCWENVGELLDKENKHYEKARKESIPTPKEMFTHLERYVIGQPEAKQSLAVAVYNHYKRISPFELKQSDSVEVQKSNVLLLGPTGTGKTYLAQSLARIMGVPFVMVDATSLTEAGYIGEDVEGILLRLIQEADGDIDVAQKGIVFIDEIDKIARRGDSASLTKDVSGEGVQQGLLKIIEGTVASVQPTNGRKHAGQDFIKIDTSDILFIASGAFSGLEEVISERMNKTSVGFGAPIKKGGAISASIFKDVETEDLHKFGLIPEFVGRFPIVTHVNPLSVEDLQHILVEPMNSIVKQYRKLFELDNVYLQFEEEAIEEIAKIAFSRKNGARGLRSIVEKILEPVMFEIPSNKEVEGVIVTAECVKGIVDPEIDTTPTIIMKLEKPKTMSQRVLNRKSA